ncbi:MAG: cell division protein FtsL [Lachnospiraceae bacterium]
MSNRTYGYNYIEGNTIRRLNPIEELETVAPKKLSHSTRKNRDKALYMNLGYLLFLVTALASAAFVLLGYLKLQSEYTLTVKHIASLESELNNLKLSNEEEYNRAISSVDLEEIRRVAIGELGMRYAKEGQIINVTGEGSDYVRQLAEIE